MEKRNEDNLKAAVLAEMQRRGWRAADLARHLAGQGIISRAMLYRWLAGEAGISWARGRRLAEALDLTINLNRKE